MTDEEKEICKFITKDEVMHWMKNHFDLSHYYHPYSKLENYSIPYTEIESMVKRMPTVDAVPVIRCKDCKHWQCDDDETYCDELGIFNTDMNSYCSYAKRREA